MTSFNSGTPLASDLFDYELPAHLIAQTPSAKRDASRLLVVDRARQTLSHQVFSDLPNFLAAEDVLFRNVARVLPARLHAQRATGGAVECFLLRPVGSDVATTWKCLLRPGKKLPIGSVFRLEGVFSGEVLAKDDEGIATIRFTTVDGREITEVANQLGHIPLPPYIERPDEIADRERYQTVYADAAQQVAVAAPTAGLHFTPELLGELSRRGVRTADLTLHVGLGTFKPVASDLISDHPIHREIYEVPVDTQRQLFSTRGRRVAVGTTSVRSIEHYLTLHSAPQTHDFRGEADLFIYPPREFRGVDALITNFHQPRSTLLCLVAAFLTPGKLDGIKWVKDIYAEAISREYRFFSYGDAMLIL